jgi:hypothetical protein
VIAAGLAVTAFGLACGASRPKPVDFSDSVKSYRAEDYDQVREQWTRHYKLVRSVGTILEVWSTFKSADFRQAYVEQYAQTYGLPAEERAHLRTAQLEAAKSTHEFHLVAQSNDWSWNDLNEKDSVWKITLIDGNGNQIAPSQVTLEKLPELYLMKFFPTVTDFSRIYTVRFPRDAAGKFAGPITGLLKLRVAGPLGAVEVVWESARAR